MIFILALLLAASLTLFGAPLWAPILITAGGLAAWVITRALDKDQP